MAEAQQGSKRKRPNTEEDASVKKKRKRTQINDARIVSAQTAGKAFGNGELDVDKFVRAREFEIRALEDGMKRAKQALSSRAFQNVPRDLRRRTASHNAKRVPKRLRARAMREMREDNTPTVTSTKRTKSPKMRLRLDIVKKLKNLGKKSRMKPNLNSEEETLADKQQEVEDNVLPARKNHIKASREPRIKKNSLANPPVQKAKFRKRQMEKTWLPTHIFHAKRAHMTSPKNPLWRMAIPLSPTAKSYRPTHRAANSRGAIAWDMTYMSTIQLEGEQECILKLLSDLGVGKGNAMFRDASATKWLQGGRYWEGWLYKRDGWPLHAIAPVTIIWRSQFREETALEGRVSTKVAGNQKRQLFLRIHPSAFSEVWQELLSAAKGQRPAVTLQDLRFEIGSIEIMGPASTEILTNIFREAEIRDEKINENTATSSLWPLLGTISNPTSLPSNVVINMDIGDPRLDSLSPRSSAKHPEEEVSDHKALIETLVNWPLDKQPPRSNLFDRGFRMSACRQLPSQKTVNKRKSTTQPGAAIEPRSTDPRIPCLLLASRGDAGSQGTWTVMLPWKCVLPIWYCLMYQSISTGGTARFGGLDEKRQTLFETGTPWFPGDFPGTPAGLQWEMEQRAVRKKEWERRPKGKRIEWDSVNLGQKQKGEIGLGWACDWQRLIYGKKEDEGSEDPAMQDKEVGERTEYPRLEQLPRGLTLTAFRQHLGIDKTLMKHGVASVKIVMQAGGVPTTCARIYRLPSEEDDTDLRRSWLTLLSRKEKGADSNSKKAPHHRVEVQSKETSRRLGQQDLATQLLRESDGTKSVHPSIPTEKDLIGFVTTGNFNLREGRGIAIGAIILWKAYETQLQETGGGADDARMKREAHLCIVRNAGHSIGRLARWEVL